MGPYNFYCAINKFFFFFGICTFHQMQDKDRVPFYGLRPESSIHKSITLLIGFGCECSLNLNLIDFNDTKSNIDPLYEKSPSIDRMNGENTSTTNACKSYLMFSQAKYVIKCSCTSRKKRKKIDLVKSIRFAI